MHFPLMPYSDVGRYCQDYYKTFAQAAGAIDAGAVQAAVDALVTAIKADKLIFACGNGGSAAISDHLVCDCMKGVQTDTDLRPRVVSLVSTGPMITAISNDLSYADVFSYQVRTMGRAGDVLVTISSSGDSENIVRAIQAAREAGMATISLTGFAGGRARVLADINLHVDAHNYGVVEDLHQSLMHIMAQYMRLSHMPPDLVAGRKF